MVFINNAARHKNHSVVYIFFFYSLQVNVIEDLSCVPYVTQHVPYVTKDGGK